MRKGSKMSAESRRKMAEAQKGRKHSEETRRIISEAQRGSKNSMYGIHLVGSKNGMYGKRGPKWMGETEYTCPICRNLFVRDTSRPTPIYCSKDCKNIGQSKKITGRKHQEEAKRKLSEKRRGEKNPAYIHGNCRRKYCRKFNDEFKERIRDKFDRRCFLCETPENGNKLCIHHIDYNKNSICNGQAWAFVPLCNQHHAATNSYRWHWFNLLIHYWAMNPEINFRGFSYALY